MKKKNGFTLVELIAVVALIGVIMLLVVPNIVKTLDKGKKSTFATLVQDIYKVAEKNYVEDLEFEEERNNYCSLNASSWLDDESIECKQLKLNDEIANYYVELNNKGKVSKIIVDNGQYCYASDDPSIDITYRDIIEGSIYCEGSSCVCEEIEEDEEDNHYHGGGEIIGPTEKLLDYTLLDRGTIVNEKILNLPALTGLTSYKKEETEKYAYVTHYERFICYKDSEENSYDNYQIMHIQKATSSEYDLVKTSLTDSNIISVKMSKYPVYAWFDNTNGTVYYYSEDSVIYLNSDSYKLFSGFLYLTDIDLSGFSTSKVTNMSYLFQNDKHLTSLDLSSFNTNNVTNMAYMFAYLVSLNSIDISNFSTGNVNSMKGLFYGCRNITNINYGNIDTSKVTDMSSMFMGIENLTSLSINFNTNNVTNMDLMFCDMKSLTNIDVSHMNTQKVETMYRMFGNMDSIETIDISSFNLTSATNISYIFYQDGNLRTVYVSPTFSIPTECDTFAFDYESNLTCSSNCLYDKLTIKNN